MSSANDTLFKELYDMYYQAVFAISNRYVNYNADDAYDLTQSVFMSVYRSLGQLRDPSAVKGWILTIAHNEGKRHLKRNYKEKGLKEHIKYWLSIVSHEDYLGIEKEEWLLLIKDYVATMDDDALKRIVTLFYYDDQKVKTIADQLNMTVTNVTTTLNRFRSKMTRALLEKNL